MLVNVRIWRSTLLAKARSPNIVQGISNSKIYQSSCSDSNINTVSGARFCENASSSRSGRSKWLLLPRMFCWTPPFRCFSEHIDVRTRQNHAQDLAPLAWKHDDATRSVRTLTVTRLSHVLRSLAVIQMCGIRIENVRRFNTWLHVRSARKFADMNRSASVNIDVKHPPRYSRFTFQIPVRFNSRLFL